MKCLVAVALCLWPSFTWLSGQDIPDFSGSWVLDMAETRVSERPRRDPKVYTISIRQQGADVTIVNPAARWGELETTYSIGAGQKVVDDLSLGEIRDFRRRLRTEATWDGERLTLKTTPFGEQRDPDDGSIVVPAGAITSVNVLRLVEGKLAIDTTGFRERLPALLHGAPYDPALDAGLRRGYTEVFTANR
jgi:hypothetical protein